MRQLHILNITLNLTISKMRILCIMYIIPCSLTPSSSWWPLMLEIHLMDVSAKVLNGFFPQREAQHSFWNLHIPSRCCLASLSLPELL